MVWRQIFVKFERFIHLFICAIYISFAICSQVLEIFLTVYITLINLQANFILTTYVVNEFHYFEHCMPDPLPLCF